MKSRVLVKVQHQSGVWSTNAYHFKGVWCSAEGTSQAHALENLKTQIEERLHTDAAEWVKESYHGGDPGSPNCPEGAIKLPIDLWVCKVVGDTCPIQAHVFLADPEKFFQGCLGPAEKKQEIFNSVKQGKYEGFHHVRGRYLCVLCESEGKGNFSYHYPWELAALEDYSSFVVERDWPRARSKLRQDRRKLSIVINALCAPHAKSVAQEVDSLLASALNILEFEFSRP